MKKRAALVLIVIIVLIVAGYFFSSKRGLRSAKVEFYKEKPAEGVQLLYDEAERLAKEGKLLESKTAYKRLLAEYPQSSLVEDARIKMDELNMRILFSPTPTENSIFYEVKPGDTLNKIAKEFGTTVELIMKSNNLERTIIRPGMQLKISTARYSILIDKSQNILILKANDEVLKTYTVSTGTTNNTPTGTFNIENKLVDPHWYKTGVVVPPGSPENILGSRWMGFTIPGYGIHGTTDESTIGKHITKGCVRMRNKDIEELYSIVPLKTEVTIID